MKLSYERRSIAELASELGILPDRIYSWQKENTERHQETVSPVNADKNFTKEHIIIAREKPPIQEASKGFKI